MKLINFIIWSSKDPKKVSTTLLYVWMFIVPYVISSLGLVCKFGYTCYEVDPSLLEQLGHALSVVVYYFFLLLGSAGTAYGLIRKLYRTFTGQNKAIQ